MKSIALIVAFLFVSTVVIVESQIIIAGAIAAAIALKIAAGAGFLAGGAIGSRGGFGRGGNGRRFGRSPIEVDDVIMEASHNDALDCAKKLVCITNTKPESQMSEEELSIFGLFGNEGHIDVSKLSVEFDLAAIMGRKVGVAQCNKIYARCPYEKKHLLEEVREAYHANLF